jgi:hypothetical protein
MANHRRDKSGLAQQFEKLKQQVCISLTPTAIALCAAPFGRIAPLDTLGRIFGIEGTALIKELDCDRYPIPDSNATRPQTSTMGV